MVAALRSRHTSFERAATLLKRIIENPADTSSILALQELLIDEIGRAEEILRLLKVEQEGAIRTLRTERPSREQSAGLRWRIEKAKARVEQFRQLLYIWRSFGDAIAFSYLDKHAVKHAFYSTTSVNPKQDSGYISGKVGLDAELQVLRDAANAGIPAVLCDLTNSIRYGDICLLSANDPQFIEVKAGERLGERGRRQTKEIDALHSFYETDTAKDLRGFSELRRATLGEPETSYIEQLNSCICSAIKSGVAVTNPERGLYYVAIYNTEPDISSIFRGITMTRPMYFGLNEAKNARAWSPYIPFTLSVHNSDHLYKFLCGRLFLMVIVDIAVLSEEMAMPGWEVTWESEDDYPLKVRSVSEDSVFGVSQHFLNRIGYEFVSPKWVAKSQHDVIRRVQAEAANKGN